MTKIASTFALMLFVALGAFAQPAKITNKKAVVAQSQYQGSRVEIEYQSMFAYGPYSAASIKLSTKGSDGKYSTHIEELKRVQTSEASGRNLWRATFNNVDVRYGSDLEIRAMNDAYLPFQIAPSNELVLALKLDMSYCKEQNTYVLYPQIGPLTGTTIWPSNKTKPAKCTQ